MLDILPSPFMGNVSDTVNWICWQAVRRGNLIIIQLIIFELFYLHRTFKALKRRNDIYTMANNNTDK